MTSILIGVDKQSNTATPFSVTEIDAERVVISLAPNCGKSSILALLKEREQEYNRVQAQQFIESFHSKVVASHRDYLTKRNVDSYDLHRNPLPIVIYRTVYNERFNYPRARIADTYLRAIRNVRRVIRSLRSIYHLNTKKSSKQLVSSLFRKVTQSILHSYSWTIDHLTKPIAVKLSSYDANSHGAFIAALVSPTTALSPRYFA